MEHLEFAYKLILLKERVSDWTDLFVGKTRAFSLGSILGVEDLELPINDRREMMLMKLHFLSVDPLFLLLLISLNGQSLTQWWLWWSSNNGYSLYTHCLNVYMCLLSIYKDTLILHMYQMKW